MANSSPVVLPSDQAEIPVKAGTNLNTSALALEAGNLAAIKAKTDNIPAQGQALAGASLPVVLPAAQITTLTPPAAITGFATETTLGTVHGHVDSIDTKTPALGQALAAASVPVVLPATQITTLTPPAAITGFALEAGHLATLDSTLGAKTDAKSTATDSTSVSAMQVLKQISASVQAPPSQAVTNAGTFAVQATLNDVTATGNITTQNLVPAGTATASSAVLSGALNGQTTLTVQVTGTYTGALSLQGTVDGTNWITVGGTVFVNVNTGAYTATIASATVGIFQADCGGFNQVRVTGLAAMTGTATVTMRASSGAGMVALDAAIPAGTNAIGSVLLGSNTGVDIGKLTANQSVNMAQIAGVAPDMNAGAASANTLRVVTATNSSVNVAQMNGVAVSMGSGTNGTGVQRMTMATDQAACTTAGLFSVKIDQTTPGTTNAASISHVGSTAVASGNGTASAGCQRVTIASDNTAFSVNSTAKTATSGGLSKFHLVSAATTNATNVKASAGQLYGWYISNRSSGWRKVALHNNAGTPTAGTAVTDAIDIPPGGAANAFNVLGIAFSTGIAITTVTGAADADTTAVGAAELVINLYYA